MKSPRSEFSTRLHAKYPTAIITRKGNLFKVVLPNATKTYYFSHMNSDGGVDYKYFRWSILGTLVYSGHGAQQVVNRVNNFGATLTNMDKLEDFR